MSSSSSSTSSSTSISTSSSEVNTTDLEEISDVLLDTFNNESNTTLPQDMTFGQAQIISISIYSILFALSSFLNMMVLINLLKAKRRHGLSRLNQLLLQLVLADLTVSCFSFNNTYRNKQGQQTPTIWVKEDSSPLTL